jgi:hypothetical protein
MKTVIINQHHIRYTNDERTAHVTDSNGKSQTFTTDRKATGFYYAKQFANNQPVFHAKAS